LLLKKYPSVTLQVVYRSGVYPFLRLPAEIRNIIYHYSFYGTGYMGEIRCTPRTVLKLRSSFSGLPTERPEDSPNVSLLYVSRQLYHETALLLYKLTAFCFVISAWGFIFKTQNPLLRFLKERSKAQIEALSHLRIFRRGLKGYGSWREEPGDGAYWMERLGIPKSSS
jgi:hypothetical protein